MNYRFSPFLALLILGLFFQSCSNEDQTNPYFIGKHQIGGLTDSTQVKDLKMLYVNDSISTFQNDTSFTGITTDIHILDNLGTHLLTLSPTDAIDSTATVRTIKIEDPRYTTAKGISINSTFGDIAANYKINKIDNLIKTIVVSVEELNASFTIDKEQLPANMRFDMSLNIDPIQVPDNAKIKYFMIHW